MLAHRSKDFDLLFHQSSQAIVEELESLKPVLQKIRVCGYAITKGDNHPELGGIAAPIRDRDNKVIASCGIAVPVFRMNKELVQRCVPIVLRTAAAISSRLGYAGNVMPSLAAGVVVRKLR